MMNFKMIERKELKKKRNFYKKNTRKEKKNANVDQVKCNNGDDIKENY